VNTRVDTVIFDLGGVLIDWSPFHLYRKIFNSDAEIAGFLEEIDLFNWLLGADADKPFQAGIEELAARLPHLAKPILAYWHRWPETINGTFDDTLAVVAELRGQSVPLYVISNWSSETWRHAEHYPFLEWFNGVVISGFERVAKPDRRIFDITCERYNLTPAHCVFIDDMSNNVNSASALGFHGIQFHDARSLRQQCVELGLLP
tara:strand:+ start:633 stop:1244 length:612 start_codon:yes stop_codon:yes gene_type:complete